MGTTMDKPLVQEAETAFQAVDLGSTVQVGEPPRYGVVKWLGMFPGGSEPMAGIELDGYWAKDCGDGSFEGHSYFSCEHGHGYFHPLKHVQPDQRFLTIDPVPAITRGNSIPAENPLQAPLEELEEQHTIPPTQLYVGEKRGIQGHYNSCYLDSTLFGLFALSGVFDTMFLAPDKDAPASRQEFKDLLAKKIINPLRKNGVVRFESVMELRIMIEDLGKMEGVQEKEKDPEELLNLLFKNILHIPPFIQIRRSFGVEDEFFIQLFISFDQTLRLPTIKELTRKMFDEGKLSLTKAPSQLLVQVPRYGRGFKTCQRIVPDLKFDISEFTEAYISADVPGCMICGERSSWKCSQCKHDFMTSESDVYFCEVCSRKAHTRKERRDHTVNRAVTVPMAELDLLSVICIETSHYVCFTRDLDTNTWLFFDSMANRLYDKYNIPRVTDCTAALNEWVYSGDLTQLLSAQPRELPELVRRFTQDVYMCVYVHSKPKSTDNSSYNEEFVDVAWEF